ncbi:alkaline phosphatase family protein, partial [Streptomyces scopuliridis]|uniref:alkaline phosphatase family protein n=1 Tax=Streptomyces scopuliridis TaxID=452529 RepID=UPI0036793457
CQKQLDSSSSGYLGVAATSSPPPRLIPPAQHSAPRREGEPPRAPSPEPRLNRSPSDATKRKENTIPATPLTLIAVIDGLRPAALNALDTPFLSQLADEGFTYDHAVAAFPALTRANAATLATGHHPGHTGIFGNRVWHHELGHIDTADVEDVRRLRDVGAMPQATIAERLSRLGHSTVVIGNGSAGCTYLLNPGSDAGHGARIASVAPDREVYRSVPPNVMTGLEGLGPRPASDDEALEWAVAAGVVSITTNAPDLLIFCSGQPDTAHHHTGLTSAASTEALRRVDQAVRTLHAAVLDTGRECNLILTADHGFCATIESLELTETLNEIADRAGPPPNGFVPTFNGGVVFGYFEPGTALPLRASVASRIVEQPWAGPVFCADAYCPADAFPLSPAVGGDSPFTPDLIITMRADPADQAGPTDPPARALHARASGTQAYSGVHGTVHPADMRIPLILHGPAFKPRTRCALPAGPADIAATAYKLVTGALLDDADGRVLTESLHDGGPALPAVERRIDRGDASVTLSHIEDRCYLLGGVSRQQDLNQRHGLEDQDRAMNTASGRPTNSGNEE